jgi:hypothetical protein
MVSYVTKQMAFIATTLFFLLESVLQCQEITNNILMFFKLVLEFRTECCTGTCLPWKSLKCFVNISLICISSYSFLTTKKAFEVISKNNVSLGSWYSVCCGLRAFAFVTPGRGNILSLLQSCQFASCSHPSSHSMGVGVPFLGSREARK